MKKYVMALDAGTTSNRCILFSHDGQMKAIAKKELSQFQPKPGWVEQDPIELWSSIIGVATEAMARISAESCDICSIGITNQRETTIVWEKDTGLPVYNAIVWQCRRTSAFCEALVKEGHSEWIQKKTGLVIDPYFSATKIRWILDEIPDGQQRAERGELLFGTVETWIIWNLTKREVHITDYTNASRTMLFNIHSLEWDQELLDLFNIPEVMLPEARPSSEIYGYSRENLFGGSIPIAGAAGDQQAALFGQNCFQIGDAKCTYGTGAFLLMHVGKQAVLSNQGLITTVAWSLREGHAHYALEGSIFIAGAAVQWLRDNLRIVDTAQDTEYMATRVDDSGGCYMVPAFTGLGSPYWDPHARGIIVGISPSTNKYHIIRATLEAEAYLANDVLYAMEQDAQVDLQHLKVDGGGSANNYLMQFQADISQTVVERPEVIETTALGAAYLAGLAVGFWKDLEEIQENRRINHVFQGEFSENERNAKIRQWKRAVERSLGWCELDE